MSESGARTMDDKPGSRGRGGLSMRGCRSESGKGGDEGEPRTLKEVGLMLAQTSTRLVQRSNAASGCGSRQEGPEMARPVGWGRLATEERRESTPSRRPLCAT